MTFRSTTKRSSDELQVNDMFTLASINYIVSEIDDTDPDRRLITAHQMIGRKTWFIQLWIPNNVPLLAQA